MKCEDLRIWQESRKLYKELYSVFGNSEFKEYYFRDQILRATLSIQNNIAEGNERQTNQENRYFLGVARGSCGEVRSMIYNAFDLKHLNDNQFEYFIQKSRHVNIMIHKYLQSIPKK